MGSCCGPDSAGIGQVRQTTPTHASSSGLIHIPAGAFFMGSEDPDANLEDGEGPVRRIQIDAFHISPTAVSNADFERFVDATDYRTEAEGYGWSYVFKGLLPRSKQRKLGRSNDVKQVPWWIAVEDASWRKPEGSGSNIRKRLDHPVVHVSWNDAVAYCNWSGYRLPSEAEWEYAARGGQIHKRFPWGDQLTPRGKHQCNIWQGSFPDHNTEADGYLSTAPVRSFPKNGIGLYNMSGNVWEWCADWWSPDWHRHHALDNPRGPDSGDQKVLKGGSYLCHETYCNRYRVAARYANTPDSTTGHAGFRVAL